MAHKIKEVRENLIQMGNKAKNTYDETGSLNAAKVAIQALNVATKTSIAQIRYKQMTANPAKIDFLEE